MGPSDAISYPSTQSCDGCLDVTLMMTYLVPILKMSIAMARESIQAAAVSRGIVDH